MSVSPNPARSGVWVSFTLPETGRATLELLDVSGRRVAEREVGGLELGRHRVDVAQGRALAPGLYLVRLVQGSYHAVAKVVVMK